MKSIKKLIFTAILLAIVNISAVAYQIPTGYRATSMPASPIEVSQIKAGDRVDMIVTMSVQSAGMVSATILQNALVLSTVKKGKVEAVVLALNPIEAQYALLSASEEYRVNFVIRGKNDIEMHPLEMATFRKLFSGKSKVGSKLAHAEKKSSGKIEKNKRDFDSEAILKFQSGYVDAFGALNEINSIFLNMSDMYGDLPDENKKSFLSFQKKALNKLKILKLKYEKKKSRVNIKKLNIEIFKFGEIREFVDFLNKINKDGYPSHACWNDCHEMCDSIYSICHIVCFHCCQTQGQGPICK